MYKVHIISSNYKLKYRILLLFIAIILQVYSSMAQVRTGQVDYKVLGISFTIPEGWKGQETAEGFIIGHDTEPGMIILSTHHYKTIEEIKQQAQLGFQDQNGTNLQLAGNFNPYGNQRLGGLYEGTLQWQPAKIYAIGMINPYGNGLTIMSGTTANLYTDKYRMLAEKLAESVVFSKPETGPIVEQWKQKLTDRRLTYMDSYYSSGPSVDGYSTGGGYSSEIKIDLCSKGYFNYISSSDVSVDTGGAFGFGASGDKGNGSWDILGNANGGATLVLRFNDGNVKEYDLTLEDGKTMLNGYRYFVTDGSYSQDQAPQCY